jgi:LPXTG-site transpeptidase (sortase) family protein
MTTLFQKLNLKKILILLLISLTVLLAFFSKSIYNSIANKDKTALEVGDKESAFQSALHPIYGTPKRIIIDSLNLDIDIVSVGVDADGYLETPKDWYVAGWYMNSARPSENGNMLIDGHYDNNYGNPAAFWKLKNLKSGDKVSVLDSYGRTYSYTVVNSYYIGINDPSRLEVFDSTGNIPALTLITCGGVWNVAKHTYSDRLVVSAELVQQN